MVISNKRTNPVATLPYPLEGYGFPKTEESLLSWKQVAERMSAARNYWICTVSARGKAHVRPVWGVWHENTVFFGGSPEARWFRNLQANPEVTVHLDDSDEAVIFEGRAALVDDDALINRLDDLYEVKYKMRHGPPIWQLHPERVFAWETMGTMTKFAFK